jgi:hypothetical protein
VIYNSCLVDIFLVCMIIFSVLFFFTPILLDVLLVFYKRYLSFFRKRKMSGFGHRVYKNYDPRAKVIRKLAEEVFTIVGRDPLIEVSWSLSV